MDHNPHDGMFTSSLERSIRLGLLSLVACFFFYPALAQGQVRRLIFIVKTGDDDLRGGNDNLNIALNFRDGNVQFKANVNRGERWPDNTTREFNMGLEHPVPLSQIASIEFRKPAGFGGGSDEWHMDSVSVRATGDGIDKVIASHGFMRFTSDNAELVLPITMAVAGKANKLELTIKTGDDDLKGGGNNNANVKVHFRSGSIQDVTDINAGINWPNDSTHVKTITLDHAVDPSDIVKIDLYTTPDTIFRLERDNWNMDSISIRAIGEGVDKLIAQHGFYRFKANDTVLSIPVTMAVAGKANKLELAFQTGGDDLRGDSDNLNVIIHFRGGSTQTARNINGGKAWQNDSLHVERITLDHVADAPDIVEIELQTTFTGGAGGDNWDMDSVTVKAIGEGINEVIFRHGAKRFTGDSRILRLRRGQ